MGDIIPSVEAESSTRRSSHTSARSPRVEVITRGARRRWTVEQKREIVAESFGPDVTPSEVARKYGIGSGQLYTWRREVLNLPTAIVTRSAPSFAKVELAPVAQCLTAADTTPGEAPSAKPLALPCADGLIEIITHGGTICPR
jgi:transposase